MKNRIYTFMKNNRHKGMSVKAWILSGFYRFCILYIPMKKMYRFFGEGNQESGFEKEEDLYEKARVISYVVNRICSQTPWESKCLVKALTAQHFLRKEKIPSTLYLGVGKQEDKIVAHAWVRYGDFYLTGGLGKEYTVVAKFRA